MLLVQAVWVSQPKLFLCAGFPPSPLVSPSIPLYDRSIRSRTVGFGHQQVTGATASALCPGPGDDRLESGMLSRNVAHAHGPPGIY